MLPSDQVPPGPDWIPRQIADLQRQLRELQAARPPALYDRDGNPIIAGDLAGQGLSSPYIPGVFASAAATLADSTASGTFTVLQRALWRWQHPYLHTWLQYSVTSTTGEIRWRIATGPDTDTVIGGPYTIATSAGYALYGPFAVPGAWLSEFEIVLEGRVASGAGAVAVRTITAVGIPTP
jgi:hypothetical protein